MWRNLQVGIGVLPSFPVKAVFPGGDGKMDRCPPMSRSSPEDILRFTALLRRTTASPEFHIIIRPQTQHKKRHATDKNRSHAVFPHLFSLLVTFLQRTDTVFRHDRSIAKQIDRMLFLALESSDQIDHCHSFANVAANAFADQDGLPTEVFFLEADDTDAENHFPNCLAVCIFRRQHEIPDK